MRLLTVLRPSVEAVAALDRELAAAGPDWPPDGWHPIRPSRWRLTLCVHGEDADPGICARRLEAAIAGLAAPLLRMAGGEFLPRLAPQLAGAPVTAAGPDGAAALAALVAAVGGRPDFRPSVTVARSRRGRAWAPECSPLHRHRGPWWRPAEVHLVHSRRTPAPPRDIVVHRVALPPPGHAQVGTPGVRRRTGW